MIFRNRKAKKEMDVQIIVTLITGLSAVAVAVIGAIDIKHKKDAEKRAQMREKEFRLSMDCQMAALDLSDVIAIAVTGGHTNGNVEEARQKAKNAKEAYSAFLKSVATDNLLHH